MAHGSWQMMGWTKLVQVIDLNGLALNLTLQELGDLNTSFVICVP